MKTMTRMAWACVLASMSVFGCDDGVTDPDAGDDPDTGTDTDAGMECPAEVAISDEITEDTSWECPVYVLEGRIFVTGDSTLTIAPGTTIYGDTAGSEAASLIITRGSRHVAEGTAAAPIVFTCGTPEGARASGDWAGVVLLGSATTN